jgi:hypothetical protein
MDLSDLMSSDAEEIALKHLPTNDDLQSVSALANEQLRLENLVAEKELELANAKEELAKVVEGDLPRLFESFSLSEIKLLDGTKVLIKEDVYAGITEENKPAAFGWLEETGNDGIIKNEIKLPFGKGQDEEAKVAAKILTDNGFSFTNSRSVHPQTLRAFVRQQLADGRPIPTDVFSIHVKKVSKIELPRKRKE